MRGLIVNADGYGLSAGITRAIEECVRFGTVRSLSANVNFPHADGLARLVREAPELSVGCHINPLVGRPVLAPERVPSLIDGKGEFFYENFARRLLAGRLRRSELRAEMIAQVEKTRALAGAAFSHVDFHMGLHRLPGLYGLFLEVAEKFGPGRIRTHRYHVGFETAHPRATHLRYLAARPQRLIKMGWNRWLRFRARRRGLAMPDRWIEITGWGPRPERITLENFLTLLGNTPRGFSEFVCHPGYVDEELKRWSSYLEPREREREILLSPVLRDALRGADVRLCGYRDIPLRGRREPGPIGALARSR